MNILLIGCTGFLGKSIIHRLLTRTNHKLLLAIRPKGNLTIRQRTEKIIKMVGLCLKLKNSALMASKNGKLRKYSVVFLGNVMLR